MGVDATLAKAGDGVIPQQVWDLLRLDVEKLAEDRGVDQNFTIADIDLHERAMPRQMRDR
jgi:hypothetical protein